MVKDNASRLHSQLVTDTGPCLIAKQRHATQLLVSRESWSQKGKLAVGVAGFSCTLVQKTLAIEVFMDNITS